ncbi:HET protein [Trichoderma sp. SZMC 28014]
MRLLKTKLISEPGAFEIEEFDDISIPQYAILSHRWGNDEPTLQDVERGATAKEGFKKVQQSCDKAKRDGIDYIWIDTCCIDKTSSQELSEAINSMYLWYFKAHRCYAYLADVPSKAFGESEWFTRGWTLQELLAPADLVFLDTDWISLGTKEDLRIEVSSCTGIPVDILSGDEDLEACSIAQRMSWAAKRSTRRVEDLAYCLLGIFGINMPLLYGEGERAFTRLQEEIMRISDDHSLFAWESHDNRGGLLATSPAAFKGSGNIVQHSHVDDSHNTLTVSSRGVHLDFWLIGKGAQKLGLALLHCKEQDGSNNQIAIYLTDLTGTMQTFQRVRSEDLKRLDLNQTSLSQCFMRRACVQTGRMIPTRRPKKKTDDTKIYEPYDDVTLENLIDRAQPRALLHAAQEGDQDDVWLMFTRKDMYINMWDLGSALRRAVKNGHESVVSMLLARGADINLANGAGYTPLMLAIEKGHENIVKLLLERGANLSMEVEEEKHSHPIKIFENILSADNEIMFDFVREIQAFSSKNWLPVFVWAAEHGQESIFKLLLDKNMGIGFKASYGPPLLRWAARGGHKGIAEWLIDRGVDVNCKSSSYGGMTPASIASLYGNEDTLKLLLEKGANFETTDDYGHMALLYAVEHKHLNTIKLLLEKGTNINAKDGNGQTALSLAAWHEELDMVKLLLENGANAETKYSDGQTLLSWAVKYERTNIIELLLENEANIETKDNDGWTPLSHAVGNVWRNGSYGLVERERTDIIKLLLKHGADIEAKDNKGRTPLSLATGAYFKTGIIKLLLKKGANLESKDNNGCTPLLRAVIGDEREYPMQAERTEIIKLLLEHGADTKARDNDGRTLLAWAIKLGRKEIIILLIEMGVRE